MSDEIELRLSANGSVELLQSQRFASMTEALANPQSAALVNPLLTECREGLRELIVLPGVIPGLVLVRDNSNSARMDNAVLQCHYRVRALQFNNTLELSETTVLQDTRLVWSPMLQNVSEYPTVRLPKPAVWPIPESWMLMFTVLFDASELSPAMLFPVIWRPRMAYLTVISMRSRNIWRPNLPNVHTSGRLCLGEQIDREIRTIKKRTALEAIDWLWEKFSAAPWNTDLFGDRRLNRIVRFDAETMEPIPPEGDDLTNDSLGITFARGLLAAAPFVK